MIQQLLSDFNDIAIHNRIDPYFESDIDLFFEDDDQFSLNLKRSSKEVSLYGESHVKIRQAFFNSCDQKKRVSFFISKLNSKQIFKWLIETLRISETEIVDVVDVGKGRSVYKLTCANGEKFIVKEKVNNKQEMFHIIATQFNISISKSWFCKSGDTYWELTPCLDPHHVFDIKREQLLKMFAKAAVIGDMFCVGDRHFDNYLCNNKDQLVSIDVSHMLDHDHDL